MIYLVDDDPIQNMLTSKLIEAIDTALEFKVFQNGEEAMEAIEAGGSPDLILLDINMPIMDGWEFLAAYSQRPHQATVVMLTSSSMAEDHEEASKYDCVRAYYTKPITSTDIQIILKKYYG